MTTLTSERLALEYVRLVVANDAVAAVTRALADEFEAVEIMWEVDETAGDMGTTGVMDDDEFMDATLALVKALLTVVAVRPDVLDYMVGMTPIR